MMQRLVPRPLLYEGRKLNIRVQLLLLAGQAGHVRSSVY